MQVRGTGSQYVIVESMPRTIAIQGFTVRAIIAKIEDLT